MKCICLLLSAGLLASQCAAQKGILTQGVEMLASPGRLYLADNGFTLGIGICGQYERQFEYQWSVYSAADFLIFIKSQRLEIMAASFEAGLKYFPAIGGGHDIRTLRTLGKEGWFFKAGSGCVLSFLSLHGKGSAAADELFGGGVNRTKINPTFAFGGGYQTSPTLQFGLHALLIGDLPYIWYVTGFRVMAKLF
jgi:hypothetical protein